MTSSHPELQTAKKKRVRNWTAADRAVHREFEKSRREFFSERLTELAKILPTVKVERRPSKHVIIDASISYHKTQEGKLQESARVIQDLISERDDILRELNTLQSLFQPGTCAPRRPRPIGPAVFAMMSSDKEPSTSVSDQADLASSTLFQQMNPSPGPSTRVSLPMQCITPSTHPCLHQSTYNAESSWSSSTYKIQTTPSPLDKVHGPSIVWNQSADTTKTTSATNRETGYDASISHIVHNPTILWAPQSNVFTTTSLTRSTLIPGSPYLCMPPNMGIPGNQPMLDLASNTV